METNNCPIFDIREQASGLLDRLKQRNKPFRTEQLIIGDSIISSRVCFEIKRIQRSYDPRGSNDLRSSLWDDRIHVQSKDRHDNYEINILIIEIEAGAKMFNEHFTEQHFKSLCRTLELSFDTHIHTTDSMDETIDLIYEYWEAELKGPKFIAPTNKNPRPKTLTEQQIYFISGLLECGDKKSVELITAFKSPMHVIKWILTREIELKGYGPKFFESNRKLLLGENK